MTISDCCYCSFPPFKVGWGRLHLEGKALSLLYACACLKGIKSPLQRGLGGLMSTPFLGHSEFWLSWWVGTWACAGPGLLDMAVRLDQ